MRAKQLCLKHKTTGTVIKIAKSFLELNDSVKADFVPVSKKKYKSFINKQTKKENNYAFLEACINKGLQLVKLDEHHVMPMHAIKAENKYPGMGSRTLYGIQLNEES